MRISLLMFLENESKKVFILCGLMQSINTPESRPSMCEATSTPYDLEKSLLT